MTYPVFKAHQGGRMKRHFQGLIIGILGLLLFVIFALACSNERTEKA